MTTEHLRPAPPHPFIVPPGMAYAAAEANRAFEVRTCRETKIIAAAYRDGWAGALDVGAEA